MIAAIAHRGPDGSGCLVDGPAGLAHARLSIIDLQTGDQPMSNEDGSVWVVFNGEIFNYVELRATLLGLGHLFRTQSDTETIVHAYEEYGEQFVEKLNGQFAIALWDRTRERLLLARDRVGIRPLFYIQEGRRILFASEIKALRAAMKHALALDEQGIAQTFTFWTTIAEQTAFRDVRSLPAGHVLIADRSRIRLHRYWDWSYPPAESVANLSFQEAADTIRNLLIDSVRLQLRADVPVGAYLSGGFDSSAITALIRSCTSTPLRTFSITFDGEEFDESPFQSTMAAYLGTEHTSIRCRRLDIGALFPKFLRHAEAPVLRTGPVPLMMLSGLVRSEGYKVVLTGEGADEVFGGYDLFKEAKIRRFWARQPDSRARSALLTRLYPYLKHSPVASSSYAGTFFGQGLAQTSCPTYAHLPRWNTTRRLWTFFSPQFRSALAGVDPMRMAEHILPADANGWEGLGRDQYVEFRTLLTGYLLSSQGDRVAMANSIEARYPFLDHRLIDFANELPARFKLRGLREKAVLRHALRGMLPEAIRQRVKQPYRAPDSSSFAADGVLLEYVADTLSPDRVKAAGYFNAVAVAHLVEKCRAGRAIGFADNMAFVGILSVMLLHRMFVEGQTLDASNGIAA